MRGKDRDLSLEAPDRAVNIGNAERHADIVRRITRGKIITAVDDKIPSAGKIEGVRGGEAFAECLDPHMGIGSRERVAG